MRTGVIAAALLLAGCGSGGGEGGDGAAAAGGGSAGDWNAADPCKTLDRAEVAKATGQAVTGATVTQNQPMTDSHPAHTAQCDYALADGQTVQLFTRVGSPVDNQVGIDAFVKQTVEAGLPEPEKVAGIGRAAFYTAGQIPHMDFFVGDDRFGFVMVMGRPGKGIHPEAPDPAWARNVAETLAKQVAN